MAPAETMPTCSACANLAQPPISLAAQITQLKATQAELQATLKANRKNAQRQDASVKSEIDSIKKSLDRQSGPDHRARQKVLALQESVKRTLAAAEQSSSDASEVRGNLGSIQTELAEVKDRHGKVLAETGSVNNLAAETLRANNAELAALQSELSSLDHKMERLNSRREKLENVQLKDVMTQLRNVREDIGDMRADVDSMILPLASYPHQDYSTLLPHPSQFPNHSRSINPAAYYDNRFNLITERTLSSSPPHRSPTSFPSTNISADFGSQGTTAPIGTGRSTKLSLNSSSPIGSGRRVGSNQSNASPPAEIGPGASMSKGPLIEGMSTTSIWDY